MKNLIVTVLFSVVAGIFVHAQDSTLTIQKAVKEAFDRNATLQQMRARLEQKKIYGEQKQEFLLPKSVISKRELDRAPAMFSMKKDFPYRRKLIFR